MSLTTLSLSQIQDSQEYITIETDNTFSQTDKRILPPSMCDNFCFINKNPYTWPRPPPPLCRHLIWWKMDSLKWLEECVYSSAPLMATVVGGPTALSWATFEDFTIIVCGPIFCQKIKRKGMINQKLKTLFMTKKGVEQFIPEKNIFEVRTQDTGFVTDLYSGKQG